ncbi:MAG: hypothetical protein U0271_47720 [Polyangiaceae bacterium]
MGLFLAGSLAAAPALTGCAHYAVYGPASYDHGGVEIITQKLEYRSHKLRLRFTFVNHTDQEIVVDRNQITIAYADGAEVGRAVGRFGHVTSGRHKIRAGESHAVHLDFEVDDDPPVKLKLKVNGVLADGAEIELPDYPLEIEQE